MDLVERKVGYDLSLIFFGLSIVSFPFYFLPSGGFQIFHLFLVLAVAFNLRCLSITPNNLFIWLLLVSSLGISFYWAFILQDFTVIVMPSVFLFGLFAFSVSCKLAVDYKEHFLKTVYLAFCIGSIIQFIFYFFIVYVIGGELPFRYTGLFNNPNQMGYFALLNSILIVCLGCFIQPFKYKNILLLAGVVGGFFLSLVSLSKASMIALAGFLVIYAVVYSHSARISLIVSVLFVTILSVNYNLLENVSEFGNVYSRLSNLGQDNDDNLEGRGYGRIVEFSRLSILGAGEGALWRFGTHDEIHSTLATILFSYGIIGLTLFLLVIAQCMSLSFINFRFMLVWGAALAGLMAYGLTHVGFRSPYFWIFLSLPFCIMLTKKQISKDELTIQ